MNQDINPEVEKAVKRVREEYKNMTSMFIHELRNPLSLLKGTLQYIEIKHPEAKSYKYWDQTFELIAEMEKMMADASALNACSILNMDKTNLVNLIEETANQYKPQAEGQQKHLSVIISPECRDAITSYYCDAAKIKQVMSNLIKNALEATSPGDFIEITAGITSAESRPMLSIQVHDNGKPIPEDNIDNIFKPFVTYKEGGTGVGLALAKRIVENHMGSISVTSSESLTSFNILLPLRQS